MLFVYYKCSYLSNCLHENLPLWGSSGTILEIHSFQKTIIQITMINIMRKFSWNLIQFLHLN
ncbi:unnamed protein product [Brassica oleracea]